MRIEDDYPASAWDLSHDYGPRDIYTLTPEELDEVATFTREVIDYNTKKGYKDNWKIGAEDDWHLKFRGFAAEKAASRLTGLTWNKTRFGSGYRELKPADIGRRVEVRNVKRDDGRLAYKRKDTPGLVYLLLVGEPPTFRAAGWLEGTVMARLPIDNDVPYPARFAQQDVLHSLPLPEDA